MKTIFTTFFSLLFTLAFAQQKDIYLIDFHNNNEFFSILGKNVANEFENSLSLCKSKYRLIPRIKYSRQLEKKTFEETKLFLKDEGIDYVIYGDISKDDINNTYNIEYILEEVNTEKIILIETISFKSLSKLLNSTQRLKAIQAQLKYDDELCKKFTEKPQKPKVIDEGATAKGSDNDGDNSMNKDSDNDGIPDAIDKEINSPIGAVVDERGVEIKDAPLNPMTSAERKAILEQLPQLPNIPFELDSTSIGEEAEMKVDQLARLLKMYPLIVVKLEGNDTDNIDLANQRAMTIKKYLMDNYKLPERRFTVSSKKGIELKTEVVSIIDLDKMDF
jgi:outer membrane protein OmpA-like peptidoglycan-associated protein